MIIRVRKNSQITIPARIAKLAGLGTGDYYECFYKNGMIQLMPLKDAMQENTSKTLKVKCFRRFHMKIDGNSLLLKKQKAEELIAYLVCEHGEPIRKEKICSELWSGVSIKHAMNSLYKVCHYINEFEYIPFFSERNHLWLELKETETDVIEFLRLCEHNDVQSDEMAVALYEGRLLNDNLYDWSVKYDAFYEIKYIDALNRLISHYKNKKNKDRLLYYKQLMENYSTNF